MFGKRTPAFGKVGSNSDSSVPPGRPTEPRREPEDAAARVVVTDTALERWHQRTDADDLVADVVTFVNGMLFDGTYRRGEISQRALQAYHLDYYLEQVANGGHSQFLRNGGGNLSFLLADIRTALTALGAESQRLVFEDLVGWLSANPREAAEQTGFAGGRAPALDELDRRLREAEGRQPVKRLSAAWIASWPDLMVVADADQGGAIRRLIEMNPHHRNRSAARSMSAIERQVTDWERVGIGAACSNLKEFVADIVGPATIVIDGGRWPATLARTTTGKTYHCLTRDGGTMIFDASAASHSVSTAAASASDRALRAVIQFARTHNVAAGVDLLFRTAGLSPDGVLITPYDMDVSAGDTRMQWFAITPGRRQFMVGCAGGGMTLIDLAARHSVAQILPSEIARHAEAGRSAG